MILLQLWGLKTGFIICQISYPCLLYTSQSFRFYERLAKGGVGYIVIGDVAPLPTFSPTPKLYSPEQVQSFKKMCIRDRYNGNEIYATRYMKSLFLFGRRWIGYFRLYLTDVRYFCMRDVYKRQSHCCRDLWTTRSG